MSLQRFNAVFIARNKEFIRDQSALAWNILFPFLIVMGFALAFSEENIDIYKVGLVGNQDASSTNQPDFLNTKHVQFIPEPNQEIALEKVRRHQLDMLLDTKKKQYWVNADSPKGYILERVFHGTELMGTQSVTSEFSKVEVSGKQIRYIDWLVPGIFGMNIMFSALFGIGYVIVRYRKNGVLKRLSATPLTALEFLCAQIASRLILIMIITVFVFTGIDYFIDFNMHGSYLSLFLLFILGTISLVSMGLIVAARIANEELAGGILNMISWPMMFLSGVWFSLEGAHPVVKQLALAFPLTHLIDGARAIMIDGAGLAEISPQLITLCVMSAIFLLIGASTFKWE